MVNFTFNKAPESVVHMWRTTLVMEEKADNGEVQHQTLIDTLLYAQTAGALQLDSASCCGQPLHFTRMETCCMASK